MPVLSRGARKMNKTALKFLMPLTRARQCPLLLHQHISAEGFDLATYKRLVKRMMQHEAEIVRAFAAPERRDNKLLYATYISRNLSNNGERDYPFLCVMTDLCDNKQELLDMSAFGHKYKTLNILPSKTVENAFYECKFQQKAFCGGFPAIQPGFC